MKKAFACRTGAAFYGLPVNAGRITLARGAQRGAQHGAQRGPGTIATPDGPLTVFDPGFAPLWHIEETDA